MRCAVGCLLAILIWAHVEAQAPTPHAAALFSNTEQGPAFLLQCVNTSAVPIPATDFNLALKVDGKEIERGRGGSFAGGVPVFRPGQNWSVMLWLTSNATHSSSTSANLAMAWGLPLATGRHTMAFRCVSDWSEEIEFYWENTTSFPR
jgi:hypothetical protein